MALSPSFELFEIVLEGRVQRHGTANTVQDMWEQLRQVARKTTNECFAVHTGTQRVVGHLNVPQKQRRSEKRIFQVTYEPERAHTRAETLELWGYHVTTVEGNDNARIALASTPAYDLFIVGHAVNGQPRGEMAAWLRTKYPSAKILALNPPYQRLHEADYNVRLEGPETWLPIVTAVTA